MTFTPTGARSSPRSSAPSSASRRSGRRRARPRGAGHVGIPLSPATVRAGARHYRLARQPARGDPGGEGRHISSPATTWAHGQADKSPRPQSHCPWITRCHEWTTGCASKTVMSFGTAFCFWLGGSCARPSRGGRVVCVASQAGSTSSAPTDGRSGAVMACYKQPELASTTCWQTIGDTAYRVLDAVSAAVQIDQLDVHEDFAGKSGPLIGHANPGLHRPYYRRIWDLLPGAGHGCSSIRTASQPEPADLIDAGINIILPWSRPPAWTSSTYARVRHAAGLRRRDRQACGAGRSRAEIDAELEYKLPSMVRSGGCLLGLDHRIPNGTPLENYRYYIEGLGDPHRASGMSSTDLLAVSD